ncbi:MAG TPA: WecB/TagA/CpsF family glycosyltransferase [Gaiellaceae bacterium]|nr:WecB/TagA/CpsF family glycosyltransferase [Gaiellaceae bacterium]
MIDLGKRNVLGVLVSAVDREAAVARIIRAAREREPLRVTALAVHGVMAGNRNLEHRGRLNGFDLVLPDGQPVRWALNLMHRTGLRSPVRGTDLALGVLSAAEQGGLPVYFYGSTTGTLERLAARIRDEFPALQVAGMAPSRFCAIDRSTASEIAAQLRKSGARIVFVGLGCPRQETFVHAMADPVGVPMIAVGAAFDYLAGTLRPPPNVLMRWGLEWVWRLVLEPRRLWRRYALLNPVYVILLGLQALGLYRPAALTSAAPIEALDA